MSVRNTVTSTRWSQVVPASSRMARTLSNTLLHWMAMSWSVTLPCASSVTPGMSWLPRTRGPMPERKRRFPTRRAWKGAHRGRGALRGHSVRHGPSTSLQVNADVLRLGEEAERLLASLAPDARVLHPPEGRPEVPQHPGVHPDDAALQRRAEAMGPDQVARPHRGGQAIAHPVGGAEDLLLGVEGDERRDRAEDLLLVGAALRAEALDQGRLDEPPSLAAAAQPGLPAAGEEPPALLAGQREVAEHLVQMRAADQRSLLGLGQQRVPELERARPLHQGILHPGVRAPFHEDARAAEADLPLVGEARAHRGGHGRLEVRVGEDDDRVLPAHLQRELLEL